MRIRAPILTGIAAALLMLGLLPACDFLEQTPKDFIAPKNFYETPDDARAVVNAVYQSLARRGLYQQSLWHYTGNLADILAQGVENPNYTITANDRRLRWFWRGAYELIKRANAVTGNVPDIKMNEALKKRLLGEARFLRALIYFKLVRAFGGVPLVLEEAESLSGLNVPRTSKDKVYAQIIKDLQFAIGALPEKGSYPASEKGRATKGAARALLGRVYLTREQWSKAAAQLERVIDSGNYALYEDLKDVFDVAKENGKESIFAVQFSSVAGANGTPIVPFTLPRGIPGGGAFGGFTVSEDLINSYEPGDERFDATFLTEEWVSPSGDTVTLRQDGYFIIKYFDEDTDLQRGFSNNPNNFPVLRFAGVLLMYAEALNEMSGGPTQAAYDAINRVRKRAELEPLEPGLSQAAFRKAVRLERRHELVLEGHRWFDLKRYGVDYLQQRIREAVGVTIPEHYKLLPIPQRAIDVNPKLEQNPGY